MQAISGIPNNALAVPSARSPFRALVWKEWRQQRWVFLCLAGLVYLLLAGLFLARGRREADFLTFALTGAAAFVGIMGVVVLSANAFAGERDEDTDQFLDMIPCRRSRIFWIKLAFVLFLVALAALPAGAWALFSVQLSDKWQWSDFSLPALAITASVLVLAMVPALVASFGGSVIATILASIAVVFGVVLGAAYSLNFLYSMLPLPGGWRWCICAIFLPALMLATLLLAALRSWSRIERTRRRAARTAIATAGLLVAYVLLPVVAAYLYVTFFAPLSFFQSRGTGSESAVVSSSVSGISPDGEYVNCDANYKAWKYSCRAALVNVKSGQVQWLTRSHYSRTAFRAWSPSGERFVLVKADVWLLPFFSDALSPQAHPEYWVVDARTGEQHSFAELCPGLLRMPSDFMPTVGWYSDSAFVFQNGRDCFFADIEHHKVDVCKAPAKYTPVLDYTSSTTITQRGVFCLANPASAQGLPVLRYSPDLPEAETLLLRNFPWMPPQGGYVRLAPQLKASGDGRWLLLQSDLNAREHQCYLVQAANGAACKLLVFDEVWEHDWLPVGFLPGTHQAVLYGHAGQGDGFHFEFGVYDADSQSLRRIPIEREPGTPIESVQMSPQGGFALMSWGGGNAFLNVVNLRPGASQRIMPMWKDPRAPMFHQQIRWLGEEHLLFDNFGTAFVMNRDGTDARPLLTK